MNFSSLIASPITAVWPLWILLIALLLFTIAMIRRPKLFRTIWKMSFSSFDRVYNDTSIQWGNAFDLRLACVLVFALSLQILVYQEGPFTFTRYLLLLISVIAWAYLRRGIRYAIETGIKLKNKGFPSGFFMGLGVLMCIPLFFANLFYVLWDWDMPWLIVSGSVVLLWLGVIWAKLYHFFVRGWKSFLALVGYWLMVEVGFLFGLYELIKLV